MKLFLHMSHIDAFKVISKSFNEAPHDSLITNIKQSLRYIEFRLVWLIRMRNGTLFLL